MSAPESREERYARLKAEEEVAREFRATLTPVDPDALKVALGGARVFDKDGEPVCGRCGRDEPVGLLFGIVIGDTSKLCKPCVDSVGRRGEALVMLVQALEDLDTAIWWAPANDRSLLFDATVKIVTQWLPGRFGLDDPARVQ